MTVTGEAGMVKVQVVSSVLVRVTSLPSAARAVRADREKPSSVVTVTVIFVPALAWDRLAVTVPPSLDATVMAKDWAEPPPPPPLLS